MADMCYVEEIFKWLSVNRMLNFLNFILIYIL